MAQILLNYFLLSAFPFAIGFFARFLLRQEPRGVVLTVCSAAVALFLWSAALLLPSHGSERIAITAVMVSCLAAGTFAAGAVLRLRH